MPARTVNCDIRDEGYTTYVSFPDGCKPEFAKTFNDGCRHRGKVLLVLDRKRNVLQVVTRKRFNIVRDEISKLPDAIPKIDDSD